MRLLSIFTLVVASAGAAHALSQPNGATIPSPMGCANGGPTGLAAVFACQCTSAGVCNIGAACPGGATSCDNGQHGTCETTLWHNPNDNTCIPSNQSGLNPATDGSLTPDTFHPDCALTFTVASRGTAMFKNAFGWYNVTGSAPAPSDLHVMLDCSAKAGAQVVLDVKNDPAYAGGDIGFFLLTPADHNSKLSCAAGNCCPTVQRFQNGEGYVYYSQRQFNPDNVSASSFIHLVVFDSKIAQHKFYFAWEDIFGGSDDDFTDLVTSVDGVQCGGAGADCNTGKLGQCSRGLTTCDKGVVSCTGLTQPSPEICNGLDDDCDGVMDNDATCPDGKVCANGQCVPRCAQSAEFACAADLACDAVTGVCIDPKCSGVTCPAGQLCRGGNCVGPCDGITCPHGTECIKSACVDPCAQVQCPSGQVCKEGICLAGCNQCGGIACGALQCATSGACTDPSCPSCPGGTWCDHGVCHDACDGAVCPPGQTCAGGACVPINGAVGGSGGTGGSPVGGSGNGDGANGNGSCSCGAMARPSGPSKLSSLFALFLLGLLFRRRR